MNSLRTACFYVFLAAAGVYIGTSLRQSADNTRLPDPAPISSRELTAKLVSSAGKFCPQGYISEYDKVNSDLNPGTASITIEKPVIINFKYKDLKDGKIKYRESAYNSQIHYGISDSTDPIYMMCTEFNPSEYFKNGTKLSKLDSSKYKSSQIKNAQGLSYVKVEALKKSDTENVMILGPTSLSDPTLDVYKFNESNELFLPGTLKDVPESFVISVYQ